MRNCLYVALLAAAVPALVPAVARAASFNSESAWRAAVGTWNQDNFETYSDPTGLSAIPALGITFDTLTAGVLPTVRSANAVGGSFHTGPGILLNGPQFPGNGAITIRPVAGTTLTGLGFWNTGGDDLVKLTFLDVAGAAIESITAPSVAGNLSFIGLTAPAGAAAALLEEAAGNGWFDIDDLQVATSVPEPTGVMLAAMGLAVVGWRRR